MAIKQHPTGLLLFISMQAFSHAWPQAFCTSSRPACSNIAAHVCMPKRQFAAFQHPTTPFLRFLAPTRFYTPTRPLTNFSSCLHAYHVFIMFALSTWSQEAAPPVHGVSSCSPITDLHLKDFCRCFKLPLTRGA